MTDNSLRQNAVFLKSTFYRAVFPAMLSILSANINVFVDGILVGSRLGADALAAISLSLPLSATLCIIGSFFASGTAINAARAIGDNDPNKSQMYYRSCVLIWFIATGIYSGRHEELTRYLLADMSLEKQGSVLSFSVGPEPDDICSASERISGFCEANGMDAGATMRVQLAMEEIMTLICTVNGEAAAALSFDLRVYCLDGITGIRIRYGGREFDPFRYEAGEDADEMYMGITMLKKLVRSRYRRTLGVNNLQVVLKKR